MKKYQDYIGKVYLYLFSMLGLILIIIGSTGLINLGLKAWVFDTTDPWMNQPPMPPITNKIDTLSTSNELTEQEKELIKQWLQDYEDWNKNSSTRYEKVRNNESAAKNISLLLVGLPLFLFHWRLIRKKYN